MTLAPWTFLLAKYITIALQLITQSISADIITFSFKMPLGFLIQSKWPKFSVVTNSLLTLQNARSIVAVKLWMFDLTPIYPQFIYIYNIHVRVEVNKSCQNTTTLAVRQPSLNRSHEIKFFESRSNFKVKVMRSKIMVPCERSCHKEYTCAIWKPYLF